MDTNLLIRCTHDFLVDHRKKLWRPMIHIIKTYSLIRPGETVYVPIKPSADVILMALMLSQLHAHSEFPFHLNLYSAEPSLPDEIKSLFSLSSDLKPDPDRPSSKAIPWTCQDTVEFVLDQLLNHGRICGILPRSAAQANQYIIRPLFDIHREDIAVWRQEFFPDLPLGWEETTAEQYELRRLVARLKTRNPDLEKNIFNSLHNLDLDTMAGRIAHPDSSCSEEELSL